MNKKIDKTLLYEAALKCFSRYGFNRTRMADVSAALGLAAGTIYRYVADKKDLYHKSVAHGLRKWQETSLKAMAEYDDPLEQLVVMVLTGSQYLNQDQSLLAIMKESPGFLSISPVDDPFYPIHQDSIRIVQDILERGVKVGRFREMDCQRIAETFFNVYLLFVIKAYILKEGKKALDLGLSGLEVILLGLVDRRVAPQAPIQLLEKHLAAVRLDMD